MADDRRSNRKLLGKLSAIRLPPLRRSKSVKPKADGKLVVGEGSSADFQEDQTLENSTPLDRQALDRDCMNCGAPLTGPFCQLCGQKHDDIRRPMWSFIMQIFDDVISTDSRTWRTLLTLIFVPGKLSKDYNDGKRARFLPPLRLYLITTVLFFITLNITDTSVLDIQVIPDTDAVEAYKASKLEAMVEEITDQGASASAALQGLQDSGLLRTEFIPDVSEGLTSARRSSLGLQKTALERVLENPNLPEEAREDIEDRLEDIIEALAEQEEEANELLEGALSEVLEASMENAQHVGNAAVQGNEAEEVRENLKEALKAVELLGTNKDQLERLSATIEKELKLAAPDSPSVLADKEERQEEGPATADRVDQASAVPDNSAKSIDQMAPLERETNTGKANTGKANTGKANTGEANTGEDLEADTRPQGSGGDTEQPRSFSDDNCSTFPINESLPYRTCVRMFVVVDNERRDGILPEHVNDLKNNISGDEKWVVEFGRDVVVGFVRVIQDPKGFNKLFNDQLPLAMILLIPNFAFILRFWHWGGRRYYMNQVIFALHYHSFLFVFLIMMVLIAPLVSGDFLAEIFWIVSSLYLIIALRNGQKQGWIRAFFKAGFIYIPYVTVMSVTIFGFLFWGLREA